MLELPKFETAFIVPFVKGKQRPRFNGHAYTPRETREAEDAIWEAYAKACVEGHDADGYHVEGVGDVVRAPKDTPIRVSVAVWGALPKSTPKRVAWLPFTTKPDGDNVEKLVLDALNPDRGRRDGAWADDAQVTYLTVHKVARTRGEPFTQVVVSWPWPESLEADDGEE